jgi:alpha-beta hydrolase superfamily lysophospholipase
VDRYINDPLCGFRCTNQLWIDLLGGLQDITKPENLARIVKTLPMLVVGGACDPVSDGKRLNDLAFALRQSGNPSVTLKIYPDARHELLNETNRDAVTADLVQWLDATLHRPA